MLKRILSFQFIGLFCFFGYTQRGKDQNYTATATNTILNTYTYLTGNAAAGASTVQVNNNALIGGAFSGNLSQGDLVMIIQMQGALMDIDTTQAAPTTSGGWGGNFTTPNGYLWDNQWMLDVTKYANWGKVIAYNNSGKYQVLEVAGVVGLNTIQFNCPLNSSFSVSGHTQIVRIPRFNNLTLNASSSIVAQTWNGQTGGVVALEINGNMVINSNALVSATGSGFRGAVANNVGIIGTTTTHTNGLGNGSAPLGSKVGSEGARKGEGIGGYIPEYTVFYSNFGRGAAANGGGGGGYQNAGGGGGSNIGSGTYTGKGVPSTTYPANIWNLELPGFAGSASAGGGRGGFSLSSANLDATVVGPNTSTWSADARKQNGGMGGHPLAYDANRLFMGGGGGAGDQDSGQGGSGGSGGGIVFVTCYGSISGSGTIESNGSNGQNTNPLNQSAGFGQKKGNDGAGGGGGGGSIYIQNINPLASTIKLVAKGGNGGNHNLSLGLSATSEASGPGGGGSGGNCAFNAGTPIVDVTAGISGTTNSSHLTEFTANGATNGQLGVSGLTAPIYDLQVDDVGICSGETATLNVTTIGTVPSTIYWYTQAFGGVAIANGTSFTTPVLNSTTTYYVGVCPGNFRIPVTVQMNGDPVISGTPSLINPSCSAPGSISGLNVTGGTAPYSYYWNGNLSPTLNSNGLSAGNYTLIVEDAFGCDDTLGPLSLTGISGPIIDLGNLIVTDASCDGTLGSISGINVSGTGLTYLWSNGVGSTLDVSNLNPGNYSLTVTDGNGCNSVSTPISIGFIAGPTIDTNAMNVLNSTCGQINGAINGIVVNGGTLPYSYQWNGNSALNTLDLNPAQNGNNDLVVVDANGCQDSEKVFVSSSQTVSIDISNIQINQPGCTTLGSVSGISVNGIAPFNYLWSNTTQTTLDITNVMAGNYILTVTDANGCSTTSTPIVLTNTTPPTANFTYTPQNPSIGENILFNNNSTSSVAIVANEWLINNESYSTPNANYIFDVAGIYTIQLIVEDVNGCKDTIIKKLTIDTELLIPNVITVDRDGNNESFFIKGLKSNSELKILNRWGQMVFHSTNYQNDFIGKDNNGLDLSDGVYTYVLKQADGRIEHGFFHLIR